MTSRQATRPGAGPGASAAPTRRSFARRGPAAVLLSALVIAAPASAQTPASDATAYAVIVGSNAGGEGQQPLRYAERDARSVADLLTDLGGYERSNIYLVTHPTTAQLLDVLARVSDKIKADASIGRQSVLLFYYSGHARAHAFNLGTEELSLSRLRESVLSLPATLTVVILDACQSGAFSRIKGAEPAADFSFNSVSRLNSAGIAVMASSSGTELSQESEKLHGSYFTHHLLVALRGAGDDNGDGKVSLDEAYRYAYNRTLVATAKTAVGRQHVTLETDLKGKGEVPLSYPARADSHLALPADLGAEVLIHRAKGEVVVAEVHKVAGTPLSIALPAGGYRAVVRRGKDVRQCDFELSSGHLAVLRAEMCEPVVIRDTTAKGTAATVVGPRWSFEAGLGFGQPRSDAYTARLGDFGYEDDLFVNPHYSLAVAYRVVPHLEVLGSLTRLGEGDFTRRGDTESQFFDWSTHGIDLRVRGTYPLAGGVLVPFGEVGGGAARSKTSLQLGSHPADRQVFWGYQLGAAAGSHLMPWRHVGFTAKLSYVYAPVIDNELGETHDSGGVFFSLGARATF